METNKQNKAFENNFWKCAKDITNGTFGKDNNKPTFSKEEVQRIYKEKYETPVIVNPKDLEWFPKVNGPSVPYNLEPYTPKDIKLALMRKANQSAPGDDGIVYLYLKKLPYLHRILATAFTMLRKMGVAPSEWAVLKMILLKKDHDAESDDVSNFRPISLTLNLGKLYHTLEADRAIDYMIKNKYLDPTAQKAYISGINGCVEHVTVVNEIIQDAKSKRKSVNINWIDLADAFGSLSHQLIPVVLKHYYFPNIILDYIKSLYSKLQGRLVTNEWET